MWHSSRFIFIIVTAKISKLAIAFTVTITLVDPNHIGVLLALPTPPKKEPRPNCFSRGSTQHKISAHDAWGMSIYYILMLAFYQISVKYYQIFIQLDNIFHVCLDNFDK